MSEMHNAAAVFLPAVEGSEDEVLAALWSLCFDTLRGVDADDVLDAIEHIQAGDPCVQVAGEQYVVVEAERSIEQDVFGCEKGRNCTDATPAQRVCFEAMIAARLEARDDRQATASEAESNRQPAETVVDDGTDNGQQLGALEAEG